VIRVFLVRKLGLMSKQSPSRKRPMVPNQRFPQKANGHADGSTTKIMSASP